MDTIDGIRPYGPGKFDTILDSYIYSVSLDGCDEEAGGVDENGYCYTLMRNGVDIYSAMLQNGHNDCNHDEFSYIACMAGVILSEDSYGFVHIEYFYSDAELNAAWREVEREVYELDWGADSDDCNEAQQDLFAD